MKDIEIEEPRISIFYPLILGCSPEAAILYGFLKDRIYRDRKHVAKLDQGFEIKLSRFDIEKDTGLSVGRQIDAEKDLIGTGLVIGLMNGGSDAEYWIYPENEDALRKHIYRSQWNILDK